MLNTASCWKWDWTAIGAIATAAAIIASLWIAGGERRHRRRFAKYLLAQDCDALLELARKVSEYSGNLYEFFYGPGKQDLNLQRSIEAGFSRLQYFGRSEQMYSYQDRSEEFKRLSAVVSVARNCIETSSQVWRAEEFDPADAVVDYFAKVAKDLKDGVEAYISVMK